MEGLKFINWDDSLNQWSLDKVIEIVSKIKAYADKKKLKDVILHSVEDSSWSDSENGRIDVEIRFRNNKNQLIQQKLLILKGEVIDGEEFHKRHDEFYSNKR